MIFRRSTGSLHSIHLFHNVDVVAFCEGGSVCDLDIFAIESNEISTLDELYWINVAELAGIDLDRIHFKSVGCKETLLEILDDIDTEKIGRISVCLDRDYDHHLGRARCSDRIAYTYGYSWENDVVSPEAAAALFDDVIGRTKHLRIAKGQLQRKYDEFKNDIRRWCEVDIALRAQDKRCVLFRKSPYKCLSLEGEPKLNSEALNLHLKEIGYIRGPRAVVSIDSEAVLRNVFGKILSVYSYKLVCHLISGIHRHFRMDHDTFLRTMIAKTFKGLKEGLSPIVYAYFVGLRHVFQPQTIV